MNKKYLLLILLCVMVLLPIRVSADPSTSVDVYNSTGCMGYGCGAGGGDGGGIYRQEYDLYLEIAPDRYGWVSAKIQSSNCSPSGASICNARSGISSVSYGNGWNIFNMYNEPILDQLKFTDSVIAGTHFGAYLYEYRSYSWWAWGEEIVTIECIVTYTYPCGCDHYDIWTHGYCDNRCTYTYSYTTSTKGWSSDCQKQAEEDGYDKAVKELEKNGASYTLSVTDPNDVRCNYPEKYADELARENIVCNNYDVESTSSEITNFKESYDNGRKVTKYYYYQMYGACINAKTSKVRYIDKDEKCTEDEYFVENDYLDVDGTSHEHWHVFTPINTKETEGYTLAFKSNTKSVIDGGVCQEYVEKYADNFEYAQYIKPTSGTFTYNLEVDKKKVMHGCYYHLTIQVPTVQKFYGEEITETTDILKGFNFYYRPIDINNPFPNGINDDSYWKEWRDSEKKEPDIDESFNEITYWTSGIDLNEIRDYNYENTYLDWETMEINGFSTFITGKNILNRRSTITPLKVYSLGCAPTNMCEYYINKNGERVENPIYQPECKDTRDMVVCP